jgi:type VI secretion system protein ImpH
METAGRESHSAVTSSVEDQLFAEPYRFEFAQAIRLMQLFSRGRSEVGSFAPPASEIVRFGVPASLSFPASEIQSLESRGDGPPLMRVNFFGATGPLGVLPIYYTELVAERVQNRDTTLRDFLDLFHHRLVSLFYRAWRKFRFQVEFERNGDDPLSQYLLDLIGMGTKGLGGRQQIPDRTLLFYAGLLAQQPRSAWALEQILNDYFGVPARVEQFLGAWYRLDSDAQCTLDDTEFESQQMSFGAIVGDEIWDPQARVRIVLGPLSLDRYLDFLPSGSAFEPLRALVRFFGGDELDFEVQLVLRRDDVPACELGSVSKAAPQLGWLTWGKTGEMSRDPAETILQL